MKILIATPCAQGSVRHEYVLSLLSNCFLAEERLANQDKYSVALKLVGGYSGLGRDRGVMASYALRNGFDKLVFIDADMAWEWKHLKMLLDSDKKIISGIAALKKYPIKLNVNPLPEHKKFFEMENNCVTTLGLERLSAELGTRELPMTVVGTAFLCIDVQTVLKTLATTCETFMFEDPFTKKSVLCFDFFATGAIENIYLGEDWGFCVQARRSGFDIFCNPDIKINHIGDHTYTPDGGNNPTFP